MCLWRGTRAPGWKRLRMTQSPWSMSTWTTLSCDAVTGVDVGALVLAPVDGLWDSFDDGHGSIKPRRALESFATPGTAPVASWAMPRRIEVELTSSRDDGTWTWRAAGARQPKGELDGRLLPAGAKVGDVLRAEADFDIEGITVMAVARRPRGRAASPSGSRSSARPATSSW